MCDEAEGYNDVSQQCTYRARKPHKCDACDERINPGDRYISHFIVYDHEPSHIKRCLRCDAMLKSIMEARKNERDIAFDPQLNCGEDWMDTIGELPEEVAALAFVTRAEMQAKVSKR